MGRGASARARSAEPPTAGAESDSSSSSPRLSYRTLRMNKQEENPSENHSSHIINSLSLIRFADLQRTKKITPSPLLQT